MFSSLCCCLEKIYCSKNKRERLSEISNLYNQFSSCTSFDAYNLIRLLVPKFDKARSSYGLKENSLAKKFMSSLCIASSSIEAQRLINFKAVKGTKDLPEALFHILKKRCNGTKDLSIDEVNQMLNSIQSGCPNHSQNITNLINNITKNISPLHQKWFCRLILKDLHLGITDKSILTTIDSNVEAAFNVCSDLKQICDNLGNLSVLCGDIALGRVFKPMLADRVSNIGNIAQLMKNKPFCVETKYDGERMQIHKSDDEYNYFSRGSIEYNQKYGCTPSSGSLTPHIHNNIKAKSCIIDGEIIVYDLLNSCLFTKAQGQDARSLIDKEDPRFLPCFIAYDIVYLNDKSLTMTPFSERRTLLESVIGEKKGYMSLSKHQVCSTNEEVLSELNKAIENGDEGLVVKDPLSIYAPDQRVDGGWYKIKTDYLELMNDTIDAVILGGYYGKNTGSGKISHFLCGLSTGKGQYSSFCKVSSGLTKSDLTNKLSKLEAFWVPYEKHRLPAGVSMSGREKPSVTIDPSNSMVLELRGAELMGTGHFALPMTLRFPRVVTVRDDKPPEDCTKSSELEKMTLSNKRGVAKVDAVSPKKRQRVGQVSTAVIKKEVVIKSSALKDKEYCILSGSDDISKEEATDFIKEHSGCVVSTPIPSCTVICGRRSISVQNVIKQGTHPVLDIAWVRYCKGKVRDCPPHLTLHCPAGFRDKVINVRFDECGDSYTDNVAPDELRDIFSRLPLPDGDHTIDHEALVKFKNKYEQFGTHWRFGLRGLTILTEDMSLPVLHLARLHGAGVTDNRANPRVTHSFGMELDNVIKLDSSDLLELLKPHISDEVFNALSESEIKI